MQDIVSASPGPVWSALRKAVRREMKWTSRGDDNGRQHLDSVTADILDDMMDQLLLASSSTDPQNSEEARSIDPQSRIYDAVMNMTCVMLIGDRYSEHYLLEYCWRHFIDLAMSL